MPVLLLLLVFGAMIGLFVHVSKRRKRLMAGWTAYAQQRGLAMTGSYPTIRLQGARDGVAIQISQWTESRGADRGRHRVIVSEVSAPLVAPSGDLQVYAEGVFAKIGKALGGQDIQLGDPAFDQAFIVRCSNPAMAGALGPNTRGTFLAVKARGHDLRLENGYIHIRGNELGLAQADDVVAAVAAVAAVVPR